MAGPGMGVGEERVARADLVAEEVSEVKAVVREEEGVEVPRDSGVAGATWRKSHAWRCAPHMVPIETAARPAASRGIQLFVIAEASARLALRSCLQKCAALVVTPE